MTFAQTWDVGYSPDGLSAGSLPSPALPSLVQPSLVQPGPVPASSVPPRPERPQREEPPDTDGHCRCSLALGPASAKAARDFTTATLLDWQLEEIVQVAVLIASELVTNAIRHGACVAADVRGDALSASAAANHGLVELAWRRQASRLVCMVTDQSARPPVLAPADIAAESGRGLQIVQALAASWGWMLLGSRQKAVWAALQLPA